MLEHGANPFIVDHLDARPAVAICGRTEPEAVQLCDSYIRPALVAYQQDGLPNDEAALIERAEFWTGIAHDLMDGAGSTDQPWPGRKIDPPISLKQPITPDHIRILLQNGGNPFLQTRTGTVATRLRQSDNPLAQDIYNELVVPMGTAEETPDKVPLHRKLDPIKGEFWQQASPDDIRLMVKEDAYIAFGYNQRGYGVSSNPVDVASSIAWSICHVQTQDQLDALLEGTWGGSHAIWATLLVRAGLERCIGRRSDALSPDDRARVTGFLSHILSQLKQLPALPRDKDGIRRIPILFLAANAKPAGQVDFMPMLLARGANPDILFLGFSGGSGILQGASVFYHILPLRHEKPDPLTLERIRLLIEAGADPHKGNPVIPLLMTAAKRMERSKDPAVRALYEELVAPGLAEGGGNR
ncbi:MAG: hypothetical protein Alpg2KO_17770 [Alphaproteobacteria bacterium]